ncbi:MAG: glycoside hydrolase family 95 protein [Carboxylicivirga sp.]|jgi:alpha-L-fucosidase 2|nr:glycoside hydrolase family 95 protein [Carboxylicivirga sp.]
MFLKNLPLVCLLLLVTGLFSCQQTPEKASDHVLWYKQPAKNWNEALPVGNGRLGAMVFGNSSNERIQLNEDSMWPADLGWDEPAGTPEDLQAIRELLFEGKHTEADQMFVDKFSRKSVVRSHQTMGDLWLDFKHENITDYRRELDIERAISKTIYKSNGHLVSQKVFVSAPNQVMIVHLKTDNPEGFNGEIRLSRPDDNGHPTVKLSTNQKGQLLMTGEVTQRDGKFNSEPAPISSGVKFETLVQVDNKEGKITPATNSLKVEKVKEAVLYLVCNTSYYHNDFSAQNQKNLEKATSIELETLEKQHIVDYQSLYNRVKLSLNGVNQDSIPTDQRIKNISEGKTDLGLETMLFNYGRYLLICSSRQGSNPANLQGLWNEHLNAPWNADYHLNINLQMNYWLANVTNLDELNQPLFDYVDKLVENGQVTAQKNFGCNGAFIPHATDLWAPTWLRAPTAYWGCSLGASGWLMQHYWQHYLYTKDEGFLKETAFPAIEQVARFYSDWLIEDPRDGYLVSAPSTSPENRFYDADGRQVASCMGSAMDQQVIQEVFDNYLQACSELNIENELSKKITEQRQQLRPGFVLGEDGRILEWDREYKEPEPGHRHMSHLYGFHPGTAVTKSATPDLLDAVNKTLQHRLDNGGAGTGWSRAWLINCYARLMDGNQAHKHIGLLFKKSMFINLFDAHPPFQIDGNFGYTAGVAEMLLQSHEDGLIRILPALPDAWKDGSVKGLKARDNIEVDIKWSDKIVKEVKLLSKKDLTIKLLIDNNEVEATLLANQPFIYKSKS